MYNLNEEQIRSVVFFSRDSIPISSMKYLKFQKKWTKEIRTDYYSGTLAIKKVSYEILAEVYRLSWLLIIC